MTLLQRQLIDLSFAFASKLLREPNNLFFSTFTQSIGQLHVRMDEPASGWLPSRAQLSVYNHLLLHAMWLYAIYQRYPD